MQYFLCLKIDAQGIERICPQCGEVIYSSGSEDVCMACQGRGLRTEVTSSTKKEDRQQHFEISL